MKFIYLALLLAGMSSILYAQFSDSFSDGDRLINPEWVGDTSCFKVNSSRQLQLNAPVIAGDTYLSTISSVVYNATWSFSVHMDFNPSSGNYCRVYLTSGSTDLTAAKSGYYLRIGYSTDNICLYKIKGSRDSLIIKGAEKMLDTAFVNLSLRVNRNSEGKWELFADTTGGQNLQSLGIGIDRTLVPSIAFGVRCIYTKTRSSQFSFDDFKVAGTIFKDTKAPVITNYKVKSDQVLTIGFSEAVDLTGSDPVNFVVEGNPTVQIIPDSVACTSFEIHFANPFVVNVTNTVEVKNIKDLWENVMKDTSFVFRFGDPLAIENIVFTPNQDGHDDFLKIINQMQENGCRLTINLYDALGRLVRQLFNDRVSPGDGNFAWDGLNDTGRLCSTGIYILYVRAVYDDGTMKEYKKTCVLSRRN